jgi:glucose/arabinose dehydrogenase
LRFSPLARRIALAPTLAAVLALTVAACSSSSSTSAATSPSASAASAPVSPASPVPASSSAPSSPGTGGNSAAVAQITANWEKFFSSSTPVSQKVTLLQNGSTFEAAITAFANFPLASSLGAKVTNVTVNSATSATVTYSITTSSGSTLLANQKGTAVYQDGVWKVGDASLCGLFKLIPGGTVPSACSSVG